MVREYAYVLIQYITQYRDTRSNSPLSSFRDSDVRREDNLKKVL